MTLPDWLLLISALLAAAAVLSLVSERVGLPLSVVLALAGLAGGALGNQMGMPSPLRAEQFETAVAVLFLPTLIFEAALGLSVRAFFSNLLAIAVLALPALLVSTVLVGASLHWMLMLPWAVALLFGAIVSATDPVAAVAVFRDLGVPERLLILVEGESLLNDGVAIVLFSVLLAVALGGPFGPAAAAGSFLQVFFGGIVAGMALGLVCALVLPWLEGRAAAALSLALAYGGFIGAEHLAGFSGVTAALGAGLMLNAFLPSRASPMVRETLHKVWGSLGYIANGLLFLLIGFAIDYQLLWDHWPAVLLALAVVLVVRGIAVVATLGSIERVAHLPRLGRRNHAVLIWGGLRGGVALALALSLPATLPQRELLVALTAGVVLGSLFINATSIGWLVRRLGLHHPSRAERFLTISSRLTGARAAQRRLGELHLDASAVEETLERQVAACSSDLARMHLSKEEELQVVIRRGLHIERDTYQHLSDADLIPPTVARTLLHEVDDHIEQACAEGWRLVARHRHRPRFDRMLESALAHMPPPLGLSADEVAFHEASARRLAARRTGDTLELLADLPNISPATIASAKEVFTQWEREAEQALARFEGRPELDLQSIYRHQAEVLALTAAVTELDHLARVGLLPARVAARAAHTVGRRAAS